MKKAVVLIFFLAIVLSSCSSDNANKGESLNDYLKLFKNANSFEYNLIKEEAVFNEINEEKLDRDIPTTGSVNSYVNSTFVRKPYYKSSLSISKNTFNNSTIFQKNVEEFNGDIFEPSRFFPSDIKASDFSIDSKGTITLNKEYENAIEMKKESIEGMPKVLQKVNDPFLLIVSLMEQNLDSFQIEKNEFEIVFSGHIKPETLVDYYINDGNEIFNILYFNYGGDMTLDALKNETIKNWHNALLNPLNIVLLTNQPTPVTLTVNIENSTYDIMIDITEARNEFYKAVYADVQGFSSKVEKSTMVYKNIIIKE